MAADDLVSIDVRSGVNERGEGFLTIVATAGNGRMILGQLDPATVRRMAMDWLESAEAAEQDAAVLRCMRKLELPDELAAAIVTELRESRDET
jgi:hypothetical protein